MKKVIGLGVVVLFISLMGVFPASAQSNMTDFQKQMMNQRQNQMRSGWGNQPFNTPTSFATPLQANAGKDVFNDTFLGTNGKSCGTCHQKGVKPLDGSNIDDHSIATIQYCYEHAIGGQKVIPADKLEKLITYFRSFGKKAPGLTFPNSAPMQLQKNPGQPQESSSDQNQAKDFSPAQQEHLIPIKQQVPGQPPKMPLGQLQQEFPMQFNLKPPGQLQLAPPRQPQLTPPGQSQKTTPLLEGEDEDEDDSW